MQKYTIVKFLNGLKDNTEFPANRWPLHVTIAGDFIVNWNDTLTHKLSDVLAKHRFFNVGTGKDDYFGVNLDVLVTTITKNAELESLHNDIVGLLASAGAIFNEPHYIKDGYRPHVTVQKNARISEGDFITINELSVVDMFPNSDMDRRKLLRTIKLAGK